MAKDPRNIVPEEVANAVNLFAHPVAGAAAMSALGFGLASHALGMWMGALTGAAGVSQRLLDPAFGGQSRDVEDSVPPQATAKKAGPASEASTGRAEAVAAKMPVAEAPASGQQLADDLKAIAGVGPKLEQVLNGLGIRSYGQIVAWTAEDIAAIEDVLGFKGRIGRDDWIGQAKALAQTRVAH